ncbi:peptidoglycan-binding domain-containing protein [Rhizobium sp. CSW-27]|uniref:peptidoglycan-binding domain-containing protein n=1 Tax=Rhizobium sp. CSW-27 TaxID=2839985 RepID=UPI001C00C5A1|nr:peptidoglycan-binding domain-containing protein [Rhizobium sp. CSW-27]MBT9368803.1 peptidoglycan-binding protein [Rhizobium sp. CSW-27]
MNNIFASVGKGCANQRQDVFVVQRKINQVIDKMSGVNPLVVDGVAGPATFNAIYEFQRQVVQLLLPDGRMSPGGMTFEKLNEMAKLHPAHSISEVVSYKSTVPPNRRLVSPYSIAVVAWAVRKAGMNGAVITDTFRTADEQARLMYENARKDLRAQYALYGKFGDLVLDVYKENSGKSQDVVSLMRKKIEELYEKGVKVSNHISRNDDYENLNVFDIGVGSTKSVSGQTFSKKRFGSELNELKKRGYIKKLLDETEKSNQCWHLEIVPNSLPLPDFNRVLVR